MCKCYLRAIVQKCGTLSSVPGGTSDDHPGGPGLHPLLHDIVFCVVFVFANSFHSKSLVRNVPRDVYRPDNREIY